VTRPRAPPDRAYRHARQLRATAARKARDCAPAAVRGRGAGVTRLDWLTASYQTSPLLGPLYQKSNTPGLKQAVASPIMPTSTRRLLLPLLCGALLLAGAAEARFGAGGTVRGVKGSDGRRRLFDDQPAADSANVVQVKLVPGGGAVAQLAPGQWVPVEVEATEAAPAPTKPLTAKKANKQNQANPNLAKVQGPDPKPQAQPKPKPAKPPKVPKPQPFPASPEAPPTPEPSPKPEPVPTPTPEPETIVYVPVPEPVVYVPVPVPQQSPEQSPEAPLHLRPPPSPSPPPHPPRSPPLVLHWRPLMLWILLLILGFFLGLLCCFWKRKQVWKMFRLLPEGSADEQAPLGEASDKGAGGGWYGAAGRVGFEPPLATAPQRSSRDAGSELPAWDPEAVDGGANLRGYKMMRDRVAGPEESLPTDGGVEKACAPCLPARKKPVPEQAQLPGR